MACQTPATSCWLAGLVSYPLMALGNSTEQPGAVPSCQTHIKITVCSQVVAQTLLATCLPCVLEAPLRMPAHVCLSKP